MAAAYQHSLSSAGHASSFLVRWIIFVHAESSFVCKTRAYMHKRIWVHGMVRCELEEQLNFLYNSSDPFLSILPPLPGVVSLACINPAEKNCFGRMNKEEEFREYKITHPPPETLMDQEYIALLDLEDPRNAVAYAFSSASLSSCEAVRREDRRFPVRIIHAASGRAQPPPLCRWRRLP